MTFRQNFKQNPSAMSEKIPLAEAIQIACQIGSSLGIRVHINRWLKPPPGKSSIAQSLCCVHIITYTQSYAKETPFQLSNMYTVLARSPCADCP